MNSIIENYKMLTNRVLIEIESRFNDHIKVGDSKLYLDTSYEPERHTASKGKLVKVCKNLRFGRQMNDMEWQTKIEAEEGNTVYFTWMAVANAFANNEVIPDISEGKVHRAFIPAFYSDLTLAVRDDKITMLNGYILVEPLTMEELPDNLSGIKTNILIVSSVRKKKSPSWGRVVQVGKPNEKYLEDVYSDNVNVAPGDIVMFFKNADVSVQFDLHADLIGKKPLFKIQRRHLLAKLEI